MKNKVGVIGAGSWGTALAKVLTDNGHDVVIYSRNTAVIDELNRFGTNKRYLSDLKINKPLIGTCHLEEAIKDMDYIVLSIPSQNLREILEKIKPYYDERATFINTSKGIELGTLKTMDQVIRDVFPEAKNGILSGPSHAEEVVLNMPTSIVSAGSDFLVAERIQRLFMNSYFRVYTNEDYLGVQLGGALKNIFALSIGLIDGLGFGDNPKAAIITRGVLELSRLGIAMGGEMKTFFGLSGMGDLIVTATSPHSRNRQAGILLGKGYSLEETLKKIGMIVESIYTTKSAYALSLKYGIEMPITKEIYHILYENYDVADSTERLMNRKMKSEFE